MLLFCDSFDHYNNVVQKYDTTNFATISTSDPRTGTQSLKTTGGGQWVQKNIPETVTIICGAAVNVAVSSGANFNIFGFFDGATNQVIIACDGTGHIQAYRNTTGGTLLGTASTPMSFGVYHYIEAKVKINSSTGTVDVHVDGVSVMSLTGQNTQQSGVAQVGAVNMGTFNGGAGCTIYWDDFYVCDTNGSYNNNFLGDTSVVMQLPNANGGTNNWTPIFASWIASTVYAVGATIEDSNGNVQRVTIGGTSKSGAHPTWATTGGLTTTDNTVTWVVVGSGSNPGVANWMAVSETPPDDFDSYITDNNVGDIDYYTYPSITASNVFAVMVNLRGEKDTAGTRSIQAAATSGGTPGTSGTDIPLPLSSFGDFQGVFETDPNTSSPWTVAALNAAQFGVKLTA